MCGASAAQQQLRTRPNDCPTRLQALQDSNQNTDVYDWDRFPSETAFVLDGVVVNVDSYLSSFREGRFSDALDTAIRRAVADALNGRRDATRMFMSNSKNRQFALCVMAKYKVGEGTGLHALLLMPCFTLASSFQIGIIDQQSATCLLYNLLMFASLAVVTTIMLSKFAMAALYYHFKGRGLVAKPSLKKALQISSEKLREINLTTGVLRDIPAAAKVQSLPGSLNPKFTQAHVGDAVDFYTVLLVTCYSEGEESLRTTLDSLAATTYRDDRKLLFIVADGIVTGAGNSKSTPDLLLDMLDVEEALHSGYGPRISSYDSIGINAKSVNRATVYAGWYMHQDHRVPVVLVVKCGMESEKSSAKPGNRGKVCVDDCWTGVLFSNSVSVTASTQRDSQLVLMNAFSRSLYNDRMTELDFDLFRKIQWLTGATPDNFEIVCDGGERRCYRYLKPPSLSSA